jgi:hypothetical protein
LGFEKSTLMHKGNSGFISAEKTTEQAREGGAGSKVATGFAPPEVRRRTMRTLTTSRFFSQVLKLLLFDE